VSTAQDIAAYIIKSQGAMSAMKLQKLAYYCESWSLAHSGESLFDERIEAWALGPITPAIFDFHRGRFVVSDWQWGRADAIDLTSRALVVSVLSHYGQLSAERLSDLTHSERPWIEARAGLPDGARTTNEISRITMRDFYRSLTPTFPLPH